MEWLLRSLPWLKILMLTRLIGHQFVHAVCWIIAWGLGLADLHVVKSWLMPGPKLQHLEKKKGWGQLFSKLALPRTLPKDFSPTSTKGSIPCGWFQNPIALIQFKCWKLHAFLILVLMLVAETNMSLGVRGLWTKPIFLSRHFIYMSLVAGLINQEGLAEKPPCC